MTTSPDGQTQAQAMALLRLAPVIPVLTIDNVADAVPLARALVAGGLPVLEVTLRTPAALDAIRWIRGEVPDAVVGAGTITEPAHIAGAHKAGAQFLVSPGVTPALIGPAASAPLPFIPGVSTVSEAMTLRAAGFRVLKLFPAEVVGGTRLLAAIAAPLPDLLFCPTGGIDLAKARDYLRAPNVLCVGGSWMAPKAAIQSGDWAAITALANEAAGLAQAR